MNQEIQRRQFLQISAGGTAMALSRANLMAARCCAQPTTRLTSPGCRRTKVKVARIYVAGPRTDWPRPGLDLAAEVRSYQPVFDELKDELKDVEFTVDRLITSPKEAEAIQEELKKADGVLVIQLGITIHNILVKILEAGKPTVAFAIPYSGHDWASWGWLTKQPIGAHFDAILTSDRKQLAAAIRPIRAIHHLREAKILDVTERLPVEFAKQMKEKFGTEIKQVGLKDVVAAYNAVDEAQARAETDRWIEEATKIVEPSKENIYKSCRQALAFEKMLADEDATVLTVDCYGSMWTRRFACRPIPVWAFPG